MGCGLQDDKLEQKWEGCFAQRLLNASCYFFREVCSTHLGPRQRILPAPPPQPIVLLSFPSLSHLDLEKFRLVQLLANKAVVNGACAIKKGARRPRHSNPPQRHVGQGVARLLAKSACATVGAWVGRMLAGVGAKMGDAGALMASLRRSALEGTTAMDGQSIVSTSKSIADLCGVLAIDHGETI
jgi:hypothetical protein